jgi:hypothetical protein
MPATTLTLADFLLARIAEDEDWANEASYWGNDKWSADDLGRWVLSGDWQPMTMGESEHIARHDPARVLAECEAKRALVIMCQPDPVDVQLRALAVANPAAWELVGPLIEQADYERNATLRILASVYADHPEYRDEWKP